MDGDDEVEERAEVEFLGEGREYASLAFELARLLR